MKYDLDYETDRKIRRVVFTLAGILLSLGFGAAYVTYIASQSVEVSGE